VEPTVFAYMQAADPEPGMQTASAITLPDWRWTRCDIKAVSLLANVLARDEAARQGGNEAIFVRDGLVTEGAASNIFLVDGGQVITSRQDQRILAGITRELLLELLRGEGIAVSERDIRAGELATAEEVWMTSSTKGVIPVVGIDGRPVAGGEPGPLFARAAGFYAEFVARFRAGEVE
jgi:D-alanine transaminase